ncbi:MAG: GGDEF domain-containing protein [Actinobacteria bacterium]|nr:GGDEF domain-containing protein [Actinomycetota bacterium]
MIERVLRTFTANLLQTSDLGSMCEMSLAQLVDVAGVRAGAVLVNSAGRLNLVASHGEPFAPEMAASPLLARAVDQSEPTWHVLEPEQQLPLMLAPLSFQGVGFGLVVLVHDLPHDESHRKALQQDTAPMPDRSELITTLSQILSLAVHHCLVLRDLEQLASLDPLSGLLNHRLGMQRLNEEVSRAKRAKARIGVLTIDLDHFKEVNDTYGTVVGDQLLSAIAWGLQEVVRGDDVLAHSSGGTFMVVTTNASGPDIVRVAERVRRQIANTVIAAKTGTGVSPVSVTASVGCVSFPDHPAQDGDELFKAAVEALAFAKETGRDQTMVAGRLNVVALASRGAKGSGNQAG